MISITDIIQARYNDKVKEKITIITITKHKGKKIMITMVMIIKKRKNDKGNK